MRYRLVTENGEFEAFCREAQEHSIVGIDTEFVWTNSFYPRFGLLQMAYDREHCILVDPLAVTQKKCLAELLENGSVTKVFHEAASDLPILYRWCGGIGRRVADTRIAGGFCGLTGRMSLAKLLATRLSVHLDKSETRTDWLARPLTDAQLRYAGCDVIYLPELWLNLASMIESYGNMSRFQSEMSRYAEASYYDEIPCQEYWQRAERPKYLRFTLQDFAVFQQLVAWREEVCRSQDIARPRVMKDSVLANMAVKHPYTVEELSSTIGVWPQSVRKYGEQLTDIIRLAMKLPKESWPLQKMPQDAPASVKNYAERILSLVMKRSELHGIEPSFVCARHEASKLVEQVLNRADYGKSLLLSGWRYELLSPGIDEIVADIVKKG